MSSGPDRRETPCYFVFSAAIGIPCATSCDGFGEAEEKISLESAWRVGQLIAGRYRLASPLDRDGSGDTWLVDDSLLDRTLMIRRFENMMSNRAAGDLRRIASLASLSHPFLIAIHDVINRPDGSAWVVMGWPDGITLRERLDRNGTLTQAEAIGAAGSLLEALDYLHGREILHGNVRPESIVQSREGRVLLIPDAAGPIRHSRDPRQADMPSVYEAPEVV